MTTPACIAEMLSAGFVRFLISEAASGVSGAAVTVDRGHTTACDLAVSTPA